MSNSKEITHAIKCTCNQTFMSTDLQASHVDSLVTENMSSTEKTLVFNQHRPMLNVAPSSNKPRPPKPIEVATPYTLPLIKKIMPPSRDWQTVYNELQDTLREIALLQGRITSLQGNEKRLTVELNRELGKISVPRPKKLSYVVVQGVIPIECFVCHKDTKDRSDVGQPMCAIHDTRYQNAAQMDVLNKFHGK